MNMSDLEKIIEELERFQIKATELMQCTASDTVEDSRHYQNFGYDKGLNSGCRSSKTRAAVKRAAIDLRNELAKINKGE